MSDIYLDPSAAALADAAAQLRHLTDTGHRVLVLGDLPDSLADLTFVSAAELPAAPPAGTWLITADPEYCAERRQTLQTQRRCAPSPESRTGSAVGTTSR
jgi:hypothetical protein